MLRAGASTSIATRHSVPSQRSQRRGYVQRSAAQRNAKKKIKSPSLNLTIALIFACRFLNVKPDRKASFELAVREPPKWVPFGEKPVEGSAEWAWWIRRFKRSLPKGRSMTRAQLSLHNPFLPDKSLAEKVRLNFSSSIVGNFFVSYVVRILCS